MASLLGFIDRVWTSFNPPQAPKKGDVLRIGLLGASKIAPNAIINAARSHPEVIIAAVAARDQQRAQAYATKYDIPIVHTTYQDLLDDPSIDAIYNPLPCGLHYEWTLKALKAGKHVLLEKPSTSNGIEAEKLFKHPLLQQPNAPVLLEAFHYRFHPAFQTFLSLLHRESIISVDARQWMLRGAIPDDDIRFQYDLAGGTLMDLGTYGVSMLRSVFGTESTACLEASYRPMPKGGDERVDHAFTAKWQFPSGATGTIEADLSSRGGWPLPWLTQNWPSMALPRLTVEHAERETPHPDAAPGERHTVQRKLTMWNAMLPTLYHRIDVEDQHRIRRDDGTLVKWWAENDYRKVYEWPVKGEGKVGEAWWLTYRYQLEEFVNRIKGRKGSGLWVDGEDSIKQMQMIDSAYLKAGLPLRPTSGYV